MENNRHVVAAAGFFIEEGATELARQLAQKLARVARLCVFCGARAEEFRQYVQTLLPIIESIKYSSVELPEKRQVELDKLSRLLRDGVEVTNKLLASKGWHVYQNVRLAKQMDKIHGDISKFIQFLPVSDEELVLKAQDQDSIPWNRPICVWGRDFSSCFVKCLTCKAQGFRFRRYSSRQVYIMADVQQMRAEMAARFDSSDRSRQRIEQSLWDVRIGPGGLVAEALRMRHEAEEACGDGVIMAMENGKRSVRDMLIRRDDQSVVGICGMGGSGKTTLARQVIKDPQVLAHFGHRPLFLTVSQSPNLDALRARIMSHLLGYDGYASYELLSRWSMQRDLPNGQKTLIVLDDVWSLPALDQLVFRIPGCKTLVVSRFNFPTMFTLKHDVELLREEEATTLFCHAAFGQKAIPPGSDESLVKQVISECEGLPLALKVIGASLRDQPEMFWASAKTSLSKGELICDSHGSMLYQRMAVSIDYLQPKVKECFLDLGTFPEDMKIPLDVLVNMWVEAHGIEDHEAFMIVVELSNKNLLTLVQDARAADVYGSYFEISVMQHDILRDLAIQLNNQGDVNARKRLLMPRRERELPRDWERNSAQPFRAQIVSVHTEGMGEMDWQQMEFPMAEVLILNFSADDYFLPPFIDNMPNLRALVVINHGTTNAVLRNFSVFGNLTNLRSLWLKKISVPQLTDTTIPLRNMRKISLVLCKIKNSLNPSVVDLPQIFPCLSDLTIDHCDDLFELPSGICGLRWLKNLSITNCHSLQKLPADLDRLPLLEILRVCACPNLQLLPPSVCEMSKLKYLDISQCVNLTQLPEATSKMTSLEKIDMRECPQVQDLPRSFRMMKSLRNVICDEEMALEWKKVAEAMPGLNIKIAEKYFTLDWLNE